MLAHIAPLLVSAAICSPASSTSGKHLPPATAEAILDRTSTRALRKAQTILRLRLDELREADFARVRAVIEHRLPVDALVATPSPVPKATSSETSCRPMRTTG
jgi:hypothetical protein